MFWGQDNRWVSRGGWEEAKVPNQRSLLDLAVETELYQVEGKELTEMMGGSGGKRQRFKLQSLSKREGGREGGGEKYRQAGRDKRQRLRD